MLISHSLIHSFELDDDFTAMYKGQFPCSTPVFHRVCSQVCVLTLLFSLAPQFWMW